jgi:hypothetical protein
MGIYVQLDQLLQLETPNVVKIPTVLLVFQPHALWVLTQQQLVSSQKVNASNANPARCALLSLQAYLTALQAITVLVAFIKIVKGQHVPLVATVHSHQDNHFCALLEHTNQIHYHNRVSLAMLVATAQHQD